MLHNVIKILINMIGPPQHPNPYDEWGCCVSCGYTYCSDLKECVRLWETYCESLSNGH